MTSLLALEIAGARRFAGPGAEGAFLARQASIVLGYSAGIRARYLASAIGCWFFIGIMCVIGFLAIGERLLSHLTTPAAAALQGLPSIIRLTLAFLLVDGWSYL